MKSPERSKGRGLDHLIEQNSTELDFLSAYVGPEEVDSQQIFAGILRFCERLSVEFESKEEELIFAFGSVNITDSGVRIEFFGQNLPLVESDMMQVGMLEGELDDDRSRCTVTIIEWRNVQQRFMERLFEFFA